MALPVEKQQKLISDILRQPFGRSNGMEAYLTCDGLQSFRNTYPRMSLENLLEMIGWKDVSEPYDPQNEANFTKICRNAVSLENKFPVVKDLESVQMNCLVFFTIFFIVLVIVLLLKDCAMSYIRNGKNVMDHILYRVYYGRLDSNGLRDAQNEVHVENQNKNWFQRLVKQIGNIFKHDPNHHSGYDGFCFQSFQEALGIVFVVMLPALLAYSDYHQTLHTIGAAVHILAVFIISSLVFYHRVYKNAIIAGESPDHANALKTIVISNIDPADCNTNTVQSYFNDVDDNVEVNFIKKVDSLLEYQEELEIAKETKSILLNDASLTFRPWLCFPQVNVIDHYNTKIDYLNNCISKKVVKFVNEVPHSAFVTFSTRKKAFEAMKKFNWFHQTFPFTMKTEKNPHGWGVEWAPHPHDIVWSSMHKQGTLLELLSKIFTYLVRCFITLGIPTLVLWIVRSRSAQDSIAVAILPYLRSFLTMICFGFSLVFDSVSHTSNSSTQLGLFFSSLVIQLVAEVLLPMLLFNDLHDFWRWAVEGSSNFNHWLRLECIVRRDLGPRLAVSIIKWTVLCCFVTSRIPQLFSSIRFWLTSSTRAEAEVRFRRTSPTFDIGVRYAEMVAQFLMTIVGLFTYPPIVVVSFFCILARYFLDRHNLRETFAPTTSGHRVHTWAIVCTMHGFAIQCCLLLYKNFLLAKEESDLPLYMESAVVTAAIGIYILLGTFMLTLHYLTTNTQPNPSDYPTEPLGYTPPISSILNNTPSTSENRQVTNEGPKKDEPIDDEVENDCIKLKAIILAVAAFLLVAIVICSVAVIQKDYEPEIVFNRAADVRVITDKKFNLHLYWGRVPFSKMLEVCPKYNPTRFGTGWITIDSECEDILIDQAVRTNRQSIFRKMKPEQHLLWTGGYFNLALGEEWHWMGNKTKTDYENFCTPKDELIAKAKEQNKTFLHIVKDYRDGSADRKACWQVYDLNDMRRMGLSYQEHGDPRMAFACKSFQ